MKLSLSWIFDHINADFKRIDVKKLVQLFNEKVAEIEGYRHIKIDLENLTLAQIKEATSNYILMYSPELKKDIELPFREDCKVGEWFLVRQNQIARIPRQARDERDKNMAKSTRGEPVESIRALYESCSWGTSSDFGAEKEMLLPALRVPEDQLDGSWKKSFAKEDYIIDVDNKSITNRPDLWGHRGFAREIALILDLDLKPENEFLEKLEIKKSDLKLSSKNLTVEITDDKKCKKLAGLFVQKIENAASPLWMAARLSKVDSRVINAIIDTTNYTMLDVGQPMHAFDADVIHEHLIFRSAKNGEKLTLLDGDEVELTKDDCVIANDKAIVSLAGIMGGQKSAISSDTKEVILESGIFDATVIRLTSARLKKRSDASARYEKSLDLNQNISAIERFVKLFKDSNLEIKIDSPILSLGKEANQIEIELSHELIEKRLGIKIEPVFVVKSLEKIGFKVASISRFDPVTLSEQRESKGYKVKVPSYRATKDITIAEDIIEEVARIYGYPKIPYILPKKETTAHNIENVLRIRKIKSYMSFACKMMEVKTYPFFDESFIEKFGLQIKNPIQVLNPVSQNYTTLINSLIPNLLKVVETNLHKADNMRFYEWGRIWECSNTSTLLSTSGGLEKKILSGIFFEHKNFPLSQNDSESISGESKGFYSAKNYLQGLFEMFNINVEWKKAKSFSDWYDKNMSAELFCKDKKIGTAGLVDKKFLNKIIEEGSAFVFEIDGEFLLNFNSWDIKFKPLIKFPDADLDISMLVPLRVTVAEIQQLILESNELIKEVNLIDSFQKPEWIDKKSLTFRFKVVDENKTLNKDEIEIILKHVEKRVEQAGAQIR